METGNIANLTDNELRKLESGERNDPQRIELESKLALHLNKNPRDLSALMLASGVISSPFMRNYYVMSLVNIAREDKDRQAYYLGIMASRLNGRRDIANELYLEMRKKYPIRAQFANLFARFLCKKYEKGSSQDDYPINSGGKFS